MIRQISGHREFDRNLRPEDRILLTTLYSPDQYESGFCLLQACYNARIRAMPEIDKTVDQIGERAEAAESFHGLPNLG